MQSRGTRRVRVVKRVIGFINATRDKSRVRLVDRDEVLGDDEKWMRIGSCKM